jgi:protein-tyrosine phosphatase
MKIIFLFIITSLQQLTVSANYPSPFYVSKGISLIHSKLAVNNDTIFNAKSMGCACSREIKLQGAINFRDFGGYLTKEGKQVKFGKLYRSADISKLTDKDLEILSKLKIQMICDLRGEKEAASAPDRVPENAKDILMPAGSENVGSTNSYLRQLKRESSADSMLIAMYSRTDHLQKKYKPVFDELLRLESDNALLIHCTAGKDRTGIGAALILYALGVDEQTIFQNYEATNYYRRTVNEQFVKQMITGGATEQSARKLMAADPKYLSATFTVIKKQYGSVEMFLEKEFGLDAEKIKKLKDKFLY